MFEYYLMGNVYKDEYVVTNLINNKTNENFSNKPCNIQADPFAINHNNYCCADIDEYYSPMTYNDYNNVSCCPPFLTIVTPYKYSLDKLVLDKYLNQLKASNEYCNKNHCSKYKNVDNYKEKHKLCHIRIIADHVWKGYDEFDIIETDREFRDNEIIKLDGKDYPVTYKFNKELNRHELHVSYDGKFEIDNDLKERGEITIAKLNLMIDEYNQDVDDMEIVIDNKFEEYQELEQHRESLFKRFKKWIRNKIKYE